jgi:hypothetical protein
MSRLPTTQAHVLANHWHGRTVHGLCQRCQAKAWPASTQPISQLPNNFHSEATFPGFEMSPKKGSIQSLCQFLEITGLFEAMIAFFSLLPKGAQVLLLLDSAVFPGYSPNL